MARRPTKQEVQEWLGNQARPCTSCGVVKPFSDFFTLKTNTQLGIHPTCKLCFKGNRPTNELERDYKLRLRIKAIEMLGKCCNHCGNSDYRVLEFDHINPVRPRQDSRSAARAV
jgi:hypothetical protein